MGWDSDKDRAKKKFDYIPDEPARYVKRKRKQPAERSDHKHLYRWRLAVRAWMPSSGERYMTYYEEYACAECGKARQSRRFRRNEEGFREKVGPFLAEHPEVFVVTPYGSHHLRPGPGATAPLRETLPREMRWVIWQLERDGIESFDPDRPRAT